ncbi:hypothetical protein [Bradyrhizobium centrosematis]|uniref:hypothetical protein n=1 Tax=Bradyrhizobium centrosematis TaxID=1300039 RepID=UPI002168B7D6|nr:hypothetical protein [Bradyrhizobium centrosematis]MCS3758663.1 hypothetical protein [Bradyrhizobium centrosematis]MCS3773449.1 hypothetical protein [Bradyrhizobium centrosematis]
MTDIEMCLDAMRQARIELSRYINPLHPLGAVEALDRLIRLLDSDDIDAALSRIDIRKHFRVMEFKCPEEAAQ